MRKLLTIFTFFILLLGFGQKAFSQEESEFDASIKAFVDIDNFSTLEVDPTSNEVGLTSEVTVRVLDRNGLPLANHTIHFYTLDSSENVIFVQPALSDSDGYAKGSVKAMVEGVYVIRAYDSTYPEGQISIYSTDTLYVFPLQTPVLDQEPYYTKGTANKLYWEEITGSDSAYEYYLQVSTDSAFNNIVSSSGWLSSTAYEFQNLEGGKMYFYRIKARNQGGGESAWSSIQFSVQDDKAPVIRLLDIGKLDTVENAVSITARFQITDDLALDRVVFFCVRNNGMWQECGTIENSGSIYTINIPLTDLERGPLFSFFDEYNFCVEGYDKAGNSSQNCEAKILLEEFVDTPVPVFTNIINSIVKRINDGLQRFESRIIETLSSTRLIILDILAILLLLALILVILVIISGSILLVPTLLLLWFLRFISFIGLRGHGKPIGMVYDAVSKKPLRFAVVHIYDNMNRLIRKDVTNRLGEFYGNLQTGRYRIIANRFNYLFPTQLVKGKEDKKLGNIYHGEYFNVSKNKEINIVVPLDPMNLKNPGEIGFWDIRKYRLAKSVGLLILVIGFSLSTYLFQQNPSFFRMLVLLVYIPVIGVYMKSVVPIKWKIA